MEYRPRLAVLGCGYWGSKHVRVVNELPSVEIAMAVDSRETQLDYIRTLYPGVRTSRDVDDLIADDSIDGVIVATPISTHHELAKALLESGKHVLIEKPMATTSAECLDLIETAESRSLTVMVGHTFEYHPAVNYLKELLDSGALGKLHYIDTARLNLGLYQPDANVLWDLAPHDFSIINYLIDDEPLSVAAIGNFHNLPGIEDVVFATMTYENRIAAHIHVSWLNPSKVRRVTMVGSEAMVVFNDVLPVEKIRIYDKWFQPPQMGDSFADFHSSYHEGDVEVPSIAAAEPLKQEISDFARAIATGSTPIADGYSGLRVVQSLEAATLAMASREHVLLNGATAEMLYRNWETDDVRTMKSDHAVAD